MAEELITFEVFDDFFLAFVQHKSQTKQLKKFLENLENGWPVFQSWKLS